MNTTPDIHWWHSFDLPSGEKISGQQPLDYVQYVEGVIFDRLDVTDKSVLDIGTWNGANAFAAERRGASKVTGLDNFVWNDRYNGHVGFKYIKKRLKSHVIGLRHDMDKLRELPKYDIVLCLGVFYHVDDPLKLIHDLFYLTKECLVLESHLDAVEYPRPVMVAYPDPDLTSVSTCRFGPNSAMLITLLKQAGFTRIYETPNRYHQAPSNWRSFYHAYK